MANSNFIDYVKIFCASGAGGPGSMHLRREKYIPKGGPDGGDGGRGGHIILRGNPQFWTLIHLRYRKHIKAEPGEGGSGQLRHGRNGEDIYLDVPLGTVAKNAETGEVLFEIVEPGEEKILVAGGRGGLGNNNFKSATNQTPRYAQPGEEGVEGWFILELKL
jgi:GTP-binding protein